jgi:acetate kinase
MRILVVNAGTSSLKLSVIGDGDETLGERELGVPGATAAPAVEDFARDLGPLDAVGYRFVHGGAELRHAVVVDDEVRKSLDAVIELAPLHMPPALLLLDTLRRLLQVPHIACFDTGFHASLPPASYTYALPQRWRAFGVRRFGFHGLSCAWSLRRAASLLERSTDDLQLIVAHLGSGASVTAIRDGRSADTSMGFTPLEGLVMATRSGSVDPGALVWLQTSRGVTADQLFSGLEEESGLLGLAGTGDMREVERRAAAGDHAAALAIDVYVHRACAEIASVAASLERVDALVFTGGVGEHSAEIRESICAGLSVLALPRTLGARGDDDGVITETGVLPAVLLVRAREDLEVARESHLVLDRR